MRHLRTAALLLLSLPLTSLPVFAQSSAANRARTDKDMAELQSYTLSMDTVTRAFETLYAMQEAAKADPELRKAVSKDDDDKGGQKSLDASAAIIASSPRLTAILAEHRFTPRNFVVAEFSVIQTSIAVWALQAGAKMSDLTGTGSTNAANIKLFQEHKAEIEALQKKYPLQSE